MVSPMETMEITEPIPIIIPNMVRIERSLLARRELKAIFIFSRSMVPSSVHSFEDCQISYRSRILIFDIGNQFSV